MVRRSPRLHKSTFESNAAEAPHATVAAQDVPVSQEVATPVPKIPKARVLVIDLYNDCDGYVKLVIHKNTNMCVINEHYTDENNCSQKYISSIPITGLATYLYTYLCAACLDDHSSWRSMQIMTSFLPSMYITRENLAAKRELIVQTLLSHVMNVM